AAAEELVLLVEVVKEPLDGAGLGDVPPAARHVALLVPARLAVQERLGEASQRADEGAQQTGGGRRDGRSRRPGVERREAVRDPRHGAADADAAGVHAAAQVIDGPARGDIAVDHGAPATDVHQALLVAVLPGERPLLVVARPDAVAVDGLAEQPGGPA